ncbi:hypothetical protein [Bordetella sp. 02P26C-1]|uniref:hypothetical protein n=1 Tax=Bordetella sp. 02P26C-1 TaxID=2683195 RepID=UPI001353493C|nr:hypothetical protein [Bordetella sp. 02P26C-1]MVW78010.1 hypothetical protein [Bordetella sp. 02P26C-1]
MSTTSFTLHPDASTLRPLNLIAAVARGGVPQKRIQRVLAELIEALAPLHAEGRVHGGIATSTVGLDASGHAHLMHAPLSPAPDAEEATRIEGYAAFEQYTDDPDWQCGPWTDVYGLSALAHAMVMGAAPPGALARRVKDLATPLVEISPAGYDREFLQTIDSGLSLAPAGRPATLQAFCAAVGLAWPGQLATETDQTSSVVDRDAATVAVAPQTEHAVQAQVAREEAAAALPPVAAAPVRPRGTRVPLLLLLGVLGAIALGVYIWLQSVAPPRSANYAGATPEHEEAASMPPSVPEPPALSQLEQRDGEANRAQTGAVSSATSSPEQSEPAPVSDSASQPPTRSDAAAPLADTASDAASDEGDATLHSTPDAPASTAAVASSTAETTANPDVGASSDSVATATTGVHQRPAPVGADTDSAGSAATAPQPQPSASETSNEPEPTAAANDTVVGTPPEPSPSTEKPPTATPVAVPVRVRPWGEVLINGRSRGVSPPLGRIMLTPGSYNVTIRNPAAGEYRGRITVAPGGGAAISHTFE